MSRTVHLSERQDRVTGTTPGNVWVWIVPGLAIFGGLGILAALFVFDPSGNVFYPVCLFHRTTGLLCPGCGSLRAMHQLLHGHISAAFYYNPMLVIAIPAMVWVGWLILVSKLRQTPARISISKKWVLVLVAVVLAFSIWRNVPGTPFAIPGP
jgi:hypothetical protein